MSTASQVTFSLLCLPLHKLGTIRLESFFPFSSSFVEKFLKAAAGEVEAAPPVRPQRLKLSAEVCFIQEAPDSNLQTETLK